MTGTSSATHLHVVSPLRPGDLVEETRTGRIIRLTEPWTTRGWYGVHKGENTIVPTSGILPLNEAILQHLLRAQKIATALDEHGIANELKSLLAYTESRQRQAVDGPDEPVPYVPTGKVSQAGTAPFEIVLGEQ